MRFIEVQAGSGVVRLGRPIRVSWKAECAICDRPAGLPPADRRSGECHLSVAFGDSDQDRGGRWSFWLDDEPVGDDDDRGAVIEVWVGRDGEGWLIWSSDVRSEVSYRHLREFGHPLAELRRGRIRVRWEP